MSKRKITDEQREKRFDKIAKPFLFWAGIAQQWTIIIRFVEDDDLPASALVDDNLPYKDIFIKFRRSRFDEMEEKELLLYIIHEVLHPVGFARLRDAAEVSGRVVDKPGVENELAPHTLAKVKAFHDAEEDSCDLLARWLQRLWLNQKLTNNEPLRYK